MITKKVNWDIESVDGNAFSLMGHWQKAAKRQGWTNEEIKPVLDECMSGNYDHLVQTLLKYTE